MGRLTDLQALTLTRPGLHGDGDTLYLRVSPGGTRSWVQRLSIKGRRRDLGLGPFPRVSITEARHRAMGNRLSVWQGHDIFIERKRRKHVPTFEEATRRVYELNRPRWSNESHAQGWIQTLLRHAFPVLATLRVDSIKQHDVLRVLEPIWTKRPETARRVRQRVRTILGWCQAYGYTTENVAGPCIDAALPRVPTSQRHYRALPYCEVGAALGAVDASPVTQVVSLCLRFVVLTAARGVEARNAQWSEIDLAKKEWRIPAERMKARREHRVPLSSASLAVLEAARSLKDESGLLFPSPRKRGHPLSNMSLLKALRDTGLAEKATVHGFRSSFRDWCAEKGKSRALANAALAHTVAGVEGAYFRSDLFAARRQLMQEWGDFVMASEPSQGAGNVR